MNDWADYPRVDYARMANEYQRHHARYVRFVEAMSRKLTCQECAGGGGWVEIVDPEIGGPWCSCGWCEGTGYVTPWLRGAWLRYRRANGPR